MFTSRCHKHTHLHTTTNAHTHQHNCIGCDYHLNPKESHIATVSSLVLVLSPCTCKLDLTNRDILNDCLSLKERRKFLYLLISDICLLYF